MKVSFKFLALATVASGVLIAPVRAAHWSEGMKEGDAGLKSAGPIAFGPNGILFVADTKSAAILAIDTGDNKASQAKLGKISGVDQKIAAILGTTADHILINDLAINPESHNAYLAVSRGRGPDAKPVLVRITGESQIEVVPLEKVKFSRAVLPDAPIDGVVGSGNRQSNPRQESITDIGFFEDRVLVAGLSNEEFSSTLRAIPFPFKNVANGSTVEIYHGSHGRFETRAPIRTFVPFKVGNEAQLLAAYTCTPLVQIPVNALNAGAKVKGKTVAELGNRNRPIDMIVYQKDGKDYLLMANSSRGVMKIATDQIENTSAIQSPVSDKQGLPYETIKDWTGIEQLDRLDDSRAVVLSRDANSMTLEPRALP
jgi:hypothetical protein